MLLNVDKFIMICVNMMGGCGKSNLIYSINDLILGEDLVSEPEDEMEKFEGA